MKRFIKPFIYLIIIAAIIFAVNADISVFNKPEEISYTEFIEKAEYGDIEKIEIKGEIIKAYPYDSKDYYIVNYVEDQEFVDAMMKQDISVTRENNEKSEFLRLLLSVILNLAPFAFVIWFINRMMVPPNEGGYEEGGNGINMIFNSGKSKGKLYKQKDTGVSFEDVAGQDEAKESLTEIIDYLHNADKYSQIGAKLPKGALLVGPPGTGKTLLAKAVAGEANVPFYSMTGSDFVEMFVGVGASRVRDMFAEAKKNSPCIIFIDEIDAIGKSRSGNARVGGNDEREQTLNQLLSEMDGFDASTAIVVLAATNRPEILDKALTRPGRFDRRVIVDKPDLKGREDILKVHSKDVHMDESVDLSAIAKATAGGVGADLANIINEAALRAVRMKRSLVTQEDLLDSVELVFAGKEKKDRIMNEKERKIVAYHEIGHAVVAALQNNSEPPVQKITIVPRTSGSLGYTLQIPEEEKFLSTKDEIISEVKTLIAGRCAEEVFFNTVTTGASNDIEKITELVKRMLSVYGMSDTFDMVAFESQESMYLDDNLFRTCSEEFSSKIDSEMVNIVKSCHDEVRNMLLENQELVHDAAKVLLEKENISGEEFMQIFRKYHDEGYSWKPVNIKDKSFKRPEPHIDTIKTEATNISNNKKRTENEPSTKPEQHIKTEPDKTDRDSVKKKEDAVKIDKEYDNPPVHEQNENSSLNEDTIPEEINEFQAPPSPEDIESMMMEMPESSILPEEPPMPEFNFDEPQERASMQTSQKKKPDEEAKPKKPAFEAPKPLGKKGKNKSNAIPKKQNQEEKKTENNPEKEVVSTNQEMVQNPPRNDMELLLNGLKNNPGEFKSKQKGSKYINLNPKKREDGILSPESDSLEAKKEPSGNKDDVTEDDY